MSKYEIEKVAEGRLKIWVALAVEERAARGRDELDSGTIMVATGLTPEVAREALMEKLRALFGEGEWDDQAIADNFVIVEPIEADVA